MISRRAFLKSLIVGVAATAAAPTFPLFVGECSTRRDFTQVVISQRKMVARIRITGAVIRDSVNKPPGTFAQWCRDEHGRTIREAAEEFKRQETRAFVAGRRGGKTFLVAHSSVARAYGLLYDAEVGS